MNYRRATTADRAQVSEFHTQVTGRESIVVSRPELLNEPSVVVEVDKDIVGVAYCLPFCDDVLEVANMQVAPSHQSQGIGGEMLRLLEEQAREAGNWNALIVMNSWTFESKNEKRSAVPFYERNGFTRILETSLTTVLSKNLED